MKPDTQPTTSISNGFNSELTVAQLRIMLMGMPDDALVCDAKGGAFLTRDSHNGSFLMEPESHRVQQRCLLPVL